MTIDDLFTKIAERLHTETVGRVCVEFKDEVIMLESRCELRKDAASDVLWNKMVQLACEPQSGCVDRTIVAIVHSRDMGTTIVPDE